MQNWDTEPKKVNLKFQMELVMKSNGFETGTPGEQQLKGGEVTDNHTIRCKAGQAGVLAWEPPAFALAPVF